MGILGSSFSSVRKRLFDRFNRVNQTGLGFTEDNTQWDIIRPGFNIVSQKAEATNTNYPMAVVPFAGDVVISLSGLSQGGSAALWVSDADNWFALGIDQEPVTCNCQTGTNCVGNNTATCIPTEFPISCTTWRASWTVPTAWSWTSGEPPTQWARNATTCSAFTWNAGTCVLFEPGNCNAFSGGNCAQVGSTFCAVYGGRNAATWNSGNCAEFASPTCIAFTGGNCSSWNASSCIVFQGGTCRANNTANCRTFAGGNCASFSCTSSSCSSSSCASSSCAGSSCASNRCNRWFRGSCSSSSCGSWRCNAFSCNSFRCNSFRCNAFRCNSFNAFTCTAFNSTSCASWNATSCAASSGRNCRTFNATTCLAFTGGGCTRWNARNVATWNASNCEAIIPGNCIRWNSTVCNSFNQGRCIQRSGNTSQCSQFALGTTYATRWTTQTSFVSGTSTRWADTNAAISSANCSVISPARSVCCTAQSSFEECEGQVSAWNATSCNAWENFTFGCQTCYPQYIRLLQSAGSVVSEVFSWTVNTVIQSLRIKTRGDQLTISAYSDENLTTQIGSDIVYTPTGVTVYPSYGITIQPSGFNQGFSFDTFEIERN